MAETVTVAIRLRPLNPSQKSLGGNTCLTLVGPNLIQLASQPKTFSFDHIASEDADQQSLFDAVGKPVAASCLEGYNASIFAYGQTGTGKTFTIQGHGTSSLCPNSQNPDRGLLPRCCEYLLTQLDSSAFSLKCSYLEIYQEQIIDLLVEGSQFLYLREDSKKGVYVDGLLEVSVGSLGETYDLIKMGHTNRHIAATAMNAHSSRSHTVFSIKLSTKANGVERCSKFHLIDLAGSERQKATAAIGQRLKEASKINRSLSALGNVINSLSLISEGKQRHIHYRDSKLTFMLKDSLGGNSKTCVVATVSQAYSALGETASTLQFAARAKTVKNRAVVNENIEERQMASLREELQRTQELLREALAGCSRCCGPQIEKETDLERLFFETREKELFESDLRDEQNLLDPLGPIDENKALRDENTAIYEQLEVFRASNVGLIEANDQLSSENFAQRHELSQLSRQVSAYKETYQQREEKLQELEAALLKSQKSCNQSRAQSEELIEALKLKNEGISEDVTRCEPAQTDLLKQLAELTHRHSAALRSNKRLDNENRYLLQKLQESQGLNSKAKGMIELFQIELADKTARLDKTSRKLSRAVKESLMWRKCADDKSTVIRNWVEKANSLQQLLKEQSYWREKSLDNCSAAVLQEEVKIKNEQIALLQNKMEEVYNQRRGITKDKEALENKLRRITEFVRRVSSEVFSDNSQAEDAISGIRNLYRKIVQQESSLSHPVCPHKCSKKITKQ